MYGHLFLLVGDSCSDKKHLLSYLKDTAPSDLNLAFPKNLISGNQFDDDSSNLPMDRFVSCIKSGGFSIWWGVEGSLCGIENELDVMLAAGKNVIISTPLAILFELRQHYPEIHIIRLIGEEPELTIHSEYHLETSPKFTGTFKENGEIINPNHDETILSYDTDIKKCGDRLLAIIRGVFTNQETIEVTILGDTAEYTANYSQNFSFIVRHRTGDLLIDANPGLSQSFIKRYFDLKQLLGVVITNDHLDHFIGLGAFLHYYRDIQMDLPIYAPLQTLATLRSYFSTLRFKRMSIAIKLHLMPVDLTPGTSVMDLPDIHLSACPIEHFRDSIALSIQDRRSGVKVAFSSDTCPSEKIVEFIDHSDLIFHDCQGSHRFNQIFTGNHSSSLQTGQITQAAMGKRLVLTNYDSRYFIGGTELINEAKEGFSGRVFTALCGQVYTA